MACFDVSIETHFCAAHALRAYKGATEPLHGHNFKVVVTVTASRVDAAGMAIDFLDLKALVEGEVGRFHYGSVNQDVPEFGEGGLSPSAENIARVIFQRLAPRLPAGVQVRRVEVHESPGCWVAYREE